ncbi:MAG TPA: DUF2490 domain-containing protein [Bacteroidia bacterium]|nr:DUF2490 domain-containing protein [Bacteroidia bacterium]HNU34588.1 DUF2490 domain-containing protein [Bacteroidia bacterium]
MKIIKSFFLLFFFSLPALAQVKDAGLWLNFAVERKITQKVTMELSQELRLNENISELATAFTEIGGEYKFNKRFSAGLYYRYIQRRQLNDYYLNSHRWFVDVSYKRKIKKISLTLRQRLQSQVRALETSSESKVPEYYMRTKLTCKLDLDKKYTPFVSGEIFYPVFNGEDLFIDNHRFSVGCDYEFNKRHSVTLFYMINSEVNVNDPWTDYISGASYKYSF